MLKKIIKALWPQGLDGYRVYRDFVLDKQSYLRQTGWLLSKELNRPTSVDGAPVPWMNYPLIEMISTRLPADARVFEFGSGYSTCYFAGLAVHVDSLEYDEKWLEVVRSLVPANARVHYCPNDIDGRYCRFIDSMSDQYDMVVVDGRDRVNCVRRAVGKLSPRGVIVLDDSDRIRYRDAFLLMRELGFRELTISGLKPGSATIERSTIFYREKNILAL